MIRQYSLSESDLAMIRQRRGDANRLRVAAQLCLLRFPGPGLLTEADVPTAFLHGIGTQLGTDPIVDQRMPQGKKPAASICSNCAPTSPRTLLALLTIAMLCIRPRNWPCQSDKGIVLAGSLFEALRRQHVVIPALDVIERICVEAITQANRRIYAAMPGCANHWSRRTRVTCSNITSA